MKKFILLFVVLGFILSNPVTTSLIPGDVPITVEQPIESDEEKEEENVGTCARYTSDKTACLECISHYHLF